MAPLPEGTAGATPQRPESTAPSGRRPLVVAGVAILSILAIGGGVVAVSVLRGASSGPAQGPVVTPTREQFVARAGEAMRNSSWLEAEAVLREAVAIYDRDQELRLQLADVLRTRATAATWQRDTQQVSGAANLAPEDPQDAARKQDSLDAYQQVAIALEIGPRTPEIEFRAGLLASESDQPDRAIEHFQAARAGAPNHAEYALYLAQAQLADRQVTEAKASLLACVNLDPESAIAWGTLAEILLRENKPDLAIENVRRARAIQPDVTLWRLVEARAHKRRGDAAEALQLLIALPAPEQQEGPVLTLIGECYALLGRPADAAASYAAASDARPTDAALAYDTALWFQRAGNVDRARTYAERASMLGNPDAQTLAAELRGG